MLETRLLTYFLAVAREKNITKAAQALHITQPTLSKQMMELESLLGKKLFIRGKRNITLTEEGRFLQGKASEIVGLINKTEESLLTSSKELRGDITIGCAETLGMKIVMDAFERLHAKHPSVRLHTYSGDAGTVFDRLDKGLIDIGIILGPTREARFDYMDLNYRDKFGLLMRRDDPLAEGDTVSVDTLVTLPLIMSEQTQSGRHNFSWVISNFNDLNVVATYNLVYNSTFLVENGVGYSFSLENLVDISANRNITFRPIEPALYLDLFLVTKKYEAQAPAVKMLISEIKNHL